MENNSDLNRKIMHPILGIPQKVGNAYVVKDYALVGKIYTIVCPQCHQPLLVKVSSPNPQKATCKDCGAAIYFKGKEIPARKVESNPTIKSDGTVKFAKPNAKIVWGNLFNRKTFEIRMLGEYHIGRDDDEIKSEIMIKDDYVSRRSVLLEVIPKGGNECFYKLTVKHAANPVLVNGKEIAIGESAYLNYGDTIWVGNTTLTFKRNDK